MPRTRHVPRRILEDDGFPVAKVSDYLADPTAVVSFDLCEPTAEDLSQVSEELGSARWPSRTRSPSSSGPSSTATRATCSSPRTGVRLNTGTGELDIDEVDAFVTDRALVTVRRSPGFDIDP